MKDLKNFTKQTSDPGILAIYLAEVGRTHATYQSAIDYFDTDTRTARRESRITDLPNIKFAADFLLWATALLHSMFQEPVWAEALTDLEARWRAANARVRERQGLPPVDWDNVS
jgi:hypothetical protein